MSTIQVWAAQRLLSTGEACGRIRLSGAGICSRRRFRPSATHDWLSDLRSVKSAPEEAVGGVTLRGLLVGSSLARQAGGRFESYRPLEGPSWAARVAGRANSATSCLKSRRKAYKKPSESCLRRVSAVTSRQRELRVSWNDCNTEDRLWLPYRVRDGGFRCVCPDRSAHGCRLCACRTRCSLFDA